MNNASHYQMFSADNLTHVFKTANADSRNASAWVKLVSDDAALVTGALRHLSGSQTTRAPGDWV